MSPAREGSPAPLWRLLLYARPYAWVVGITLVFSLLYAGGLTGRAYLVKPLLDDVLAPQISADSLAKLRNSAEGAKLDPELQEQLHSEREAMEARVREGFWTILLAGLAIVPGHAGRAADPRLLGRVGDDPHGNRLAVRHRQQAPASAAEPPSDRHARRLRHPHEQRYADREPRPGPGLWRGGAGRLPDPRGRGGGVVPELAARARDLARGSARRRGVASLRCAHPPLQRQTPAAGRRGDAAPAADPLGDQADQGLPHREARARDVSGRAHALFPALHEGDPQPRLLPLLGRASQPGSIRRRFDRGRVRHHPTVSGTSRRVSWPPSSPSRR